MESNLRYMYSTLCNESKLKSGEVEKSKEYLAEKNAELEKLKQINKDTENRLNDVDTEVLLMTHEIITIEGFCNRLKQELDERKIQEELLVGPQVKALNDEINLLKREIATKQQSLSTSSEVKQRLQEMIEVHSEEI